ncbi:hypothetical protein ACFOGJ_18825 [Marinibaculum pumilum]|uniref:Allene oxide cyclase barrel-like domain-containing protein n=1 Tax=Marinibaculum pumilum TaxID=1766165 RepID=A0ABV7L3W6_9PROT
MFPVPKASLTAIAILGAVLSAPAAADDHGPLCGKVTMGGHDREVVSLDHGESGATRADVRIGRMELRDADGNRVGDALWHATMVREGKDGMSDAYMGDYAFEDQSGVLFGRFLHVDRIDFHNPNHRPKEVEIAVLGGTRAYRHARGVVHLDLKVNPPQYMFAVDCE